MCRPGDIVAVQISVLLRHMQLLRGLGIKAIEIPTDPDCGISIKRWSWRFSSGPIKGVYPGAELQ